MVDALESVVDGKWRDVFTCKDRVCGTLPDFNFFNGRRVLDLGYSKGLTTKEIYEKSDCLGVVGADINEDRIYYAKLNNPYPDITFVCGSEERFKDEEFGCVLAMNNYLFSMSENFNEVLDSVSRIVEKEGLMIFATTRAIARSFGGVVIGGDYVVLEKRKGLKVVDSGLTNGREFMRSYDISRDNVLRILKEFS